ncbi:MAG TPA: oxygen-independent coproporphyrinogen III oxidase [Erythrobacter sp.]|nr:oxygen-independent coproporphyrinogen III oxidase [Erythrobacter sp.]
MWPYHPELLTTPVPRYTSYPTAADFGELVSSDYDRALEQAAGDISLYLHIPFCEKLCFYCGCNTGAAGRRHRLESYLAALHSEIDLVAARLPQGSKIRRVAFGGGSPNAITPVDFIRLVESLTLRFNLNEPDFSIELDPRTMNEEWALVIESVGITRASMGVQTFAPHCQQAIGRVQDDDLISRFVEWLREAGVSSLNFDLMYGLPGQSRGDLIDNLEHTVMLGADRAAVFGYAHVPDMIPRQRVIDDSHLPGQAERFAMAGDAFEHMTSNGYAPIGFDHFALHDDPLARAASEGALRRNFQGFTDDISPVLIGLGSSAISSFPQLLAQNEKSSGRYRMIISQEKLTASRGTKRSKDDQLRGKIIEGLLCQSQSEIPAAVMGEVEGVLQPFISRGLAIVDGEKLAISPDGLSYARTIAALFDPYRRQSRRRFSSAV